MANLYFTEATPVEAFRIGATVEVVGEEARHAVRVSRLRVGERVLIGDGDGTVGEGVVESTAKERFTVRIDQMRAEPASRSRLVLVQALAKGDRAERAVEQATEFGVDAIVPWQSERSVSRWDGSGGDKTVKGVAKWARVAREAAKQSLRARIPVVELPTSLESLCSLAAGEHNHVLVLHPGGSQRLSDWARSTLEADDGSTLYLVVGPEGGLSDAELEALSAAGASIVQLGRTVLRTSSAGPAALAVLHVARGEW